MKRWTQTFVLDQRCLETETEILDFIEAVKIWKWVANNKQLFEDRKPKEMIFMVHDEPQWYVSWFMSNHDRPPNFNKDHHTGQWTVDRMTLTNSVA